MLERIRSSLDNSDAWTSTGPSGLNDAAKAYVELHGRQVLMPWITRDTEPGWLAFLGDNNMSVPWFVDNFKLRSDAARRRRRRRPRLLAKPGGRPRSVRWLQDVRKRVVQGAVAARAVCAPLPWLLSWRT
jgi:hypothetical protein